MLIGVIIFFLFIIVLLMIPVALSFKIYWKSEFEGNIELSWFFGIINASFHPLKSTNHPAKYEQRKNKSRYPQRSMYKNNKFLYIIGQTRFRQRLTLFMVDLWHAINKRDMNLNIRIGTGDPAETGQLWAIFGPVAGILSTVKDASIEIEPEFFDTTFELQSRGNIQFTPLKISCIIIGILLSPTIWKGVKQMKQVEQ